MGKSSAFDLEYRKRTSVSARVSSIKMTSELGLEPDWRQSNKAGGMKVGEGGREISGSKAQGGERMTASLMWLERGRYAPGCV
jgi:hypothetical protein